MSDPTPDSSPSQLTPALPDRAIAFGGEGATNIRAGLTINIRGDDIEIERQGTTLSAAVGNAIIQQTAAALAGNCLKAHGVKGVTHLFMQLRCAERHARVGEPDQGRSYFRAAADAKAAELSMGHGS